MQNDSLKLITMMYYQMSAYAIKWDAQFCIAALDKFQSQ
jgi:hypothetical protein